MNFDKSPIRRIVVAIDASPQSLSALDTAAQIAAHLQIELAGLFVEDINVLKTAALPFTREVNRLSGDVHPVDQERIVRQLKSQARQAQVALEKVALQRQVKFSFRVVRGRVTQELEAATEEVDLVALGRTGWSFGQRLGSTAQTIVAHSRGLTLLHKSSIVTNSSIVILFDGSEESEKALHIGTSIERDHEVVVLVLAVDETEWHEKKSRAESILSVLQRQAIFQRVFSLDGLEQKAIQNMLVVPQTLREGISERLNGLDCSILLVR